MSVSFGEKHKIVLIDIQGRHVKDGYLKTDPRRTDFIRVEGRIYQRYAMHRGGMYQEIRIKNLNIRAEEE